MNADLRRYLRGWVPFSIRKEAALLQRNIRDRMVGVDFAAVGMETHPFHRIHTHQQRVMPSRSYAQKVHNLTLATQQIQAVVIGPRQVFSFNHVVGEASSRRGYQKSRSLINDRLTLTSGGGLCQLSGLIYQMSLMAGFRIRERHSHSNDIYTEDTRFTPLGSDATVVYGFKDLRVQNPTDHCFRFRFNIEPPIISIHLEGTATIPLRTISYHIVQQRPRVIVETRDQSGDVLVTSVYKPRSP